jgi:hypothetical protein
MRRLTAERPRSGAASRGPSSMLLSIGPWPEEHLALVHTQARPGASRTKACRGGSRRACSTCACRPRYVSSRVPRGRRLPGHPTGETNARATSSFNMVAQRAQKRALFGIRIDRRNIINPHRPGADRTGGPIHVQRCSWLVRSINRHRLPFADSCNPVDTRIPIAL